MMRNVRAVVVGAGACAVLGGFVVGVPICLVTLIGNPLPAGLPTWSSLVTVVENGALPSGALVRVLAVAVWIWWSQVALSFLAESVAACRGRTARPLPLRVLGMQSVVVRLVAFVVAAAGMFGALAHPAVAATPSFADVAIPMKTSGSIHAPREGVFVGPTSGEPPAVQEAPPPVLAPPQSSFTGVPLTSAVPEPPAPAPEPPAPAPEPPAPVLGSPRHGSVVPAPAANTVVDSTVRLRGAPPAVRFTPASDATTPTDSVEPALPVTGESGWVVVRPGDSLWRLAERHLGDAMRWGEIYELNSGPLPGGGTLRDPNLIHPGWRLRIPTLERSAAASPTVGNQLSESPAPQISSAPPLQCFSESDTSHA